MPDEKQKKERNLPQRQGGEQERERGMTRGGREGGLGRYGASHTPFSFMRRMMEDMDRLFEDFGGGRGGMRLFEAETFEPRIDVFEREGKLVVRADVPGVKRDDLQVHLDDDAIVIAGERKEEREDEREGFFHSERIHGSFERRIPLPRGIDTSACDASFDDGVLEITLPLPQQARRRIDVRGSQPKQQQQQQQRPVATTEPKNGPAPTSRH